MGGNWLTTDPKAEQEAMAKKNAYNYSNGLLYDTCKHIRAIKAEYFSSYRLSGILIDAFVSLAIRDWHWLRDGEQVSDHSKSYEESLLDYYKLVPRSMIYAPGSGIQVNAYDWEVLGKVLNKIVE
jgi:hypothetical protein